MTALSAQPGTIGTTACTHCGLDVPAGLVEHDAEHQFCCEGCRAAFHVIHEGGLAKFYALREREEVAMRAARPSRARAYAEFDDPSFQNLYCRACAGNLRSTELLLEGVHCAACVWLLEKLPTLVPGVIEARLNLRRASLRLVWSEDQVRLSTIARTLATLGYAPHPARGRTAEDIRRADDRRALIRIAVAGACAGNVMLLFIALYAGLFDAMDPAHVQLFRWASMGLSVIAILWPGGVFFRGAWAAIRARTLTLDVPLALGFGAGLVWGVVNTIRGTGDLYFDSLAALILFLLVGRFIQHRQQRTAADSVELLFSLTPTSARVVDGEATREVPIDAIREGQLVEVLAGESFPADGAIETGETRVDRSLLTGESRPVRLDVGDVVHAGTVNMSGVVRVRVTATGEATRVGQLMRLVEEGSRRKGAVVQFADTFAGWFILAILILSTVTAALWWQTSPQRAIDHAIALLIATCPCGLGLATPLAMTVALGQAARRGILIKGAESVEQIARSGGAGVIILDKTGTITRGRTALVQWWGSSEARSIAAAVEVMSSHHVARALTDGMPTTGLVVANFQEHTGQGVTAVVGGHNVRIGSSTFTQHAATSDEARAALATAQQCGLSPVVVVVNDVVVGIAGLGDAVRPDAAASVQALTAMGWRVIVASGDAPHVVAAVGAALGLRPQDCLGGLTPEQKTQLVRNTRGLGPVVMVGDGVNDAPALAEATVGIAVHGGAEASLAAADIYTSREGLAPVVDVMAGSQRAMRVVKRAIVVSIVYNVVVAGLAMAGMVTPLAAAILMPAASLSVLAICVRARTFEPKPAHDESESMGAAPALQGGA
ncbi:MAG TPA: heavy metal translocating P-type ATPase [Phycisphaerales bacterium]|nr:heavy metal translocating P-type ATPase [Phycisphaerales bacterium]